MRFQLIHTYIDTRLIGLDQRVDNLGRGNPAQSHADQRENPDPDSRRQGGNPQSHGNEAKKYRNYNKD
jgi:hypothetical protein